MEPDATPTSHDLRFPDDVSIWSVEYERLALEVNAETRSVIEGHERDRDAEIERHRVAGADLESTAEHRILEANQTLDRAVATIGRQHQEARAEAENVMKIDRDLILREAIDRQNAAKAAIEEATWLAETVYEANEDRPRLEYEESRSELAKSREDFQELERRMVRESRRYLQRRPRRPEAPETLPADPETTLRLELATAREVVERFRRIPIAILYRGPIFVPPLMASVGFGAGLGWWLDPSAKSAQIGAAIGLGAFVLIYLVGYVFATKAVRSGWRAFHRAEGLILLAFDAVERDAGDRRQREETSLVVTRDRELEEAKEKFKPRIGDAKRKALDRIRKLEKAAPSRLAELDRDFDEKLAKARVDCEQAIDFARRAREDGVAEESRRHETRMSEAQREFTVRIAAQRTSWITNAPVLSSRLTTAIEFVEARFPPLNSDRAANWIPPTEPPRGIPFGNLSYRRTALEPEVRTALGLDGDDRLEFPLPAALGLPSRASMSIVVDEKSRDRGLATLRSIMLRILLAVPPGKAQFTLLDPVGLGENFAGFMHLEDERPGLVGERIWTERGQIEQRLVNLTETMETVIQKYLRNEFESIEAYNEVAGEIAEPYRFLVISDFPQGFSEEAVRRLTSVLRSGPRCGVFTLLLHEAKAAMPETFDPSVLVETSLQLRLDEGRTVYEVPGLSELPLTLDDAPTDARLIDLVKDVGRAAAEAGKVEVPFETIAPACAEDFWSRSATEEIRIPLGRSGASRLQDLVLGRGTAQHALIAGKTGSGKSTLLHALITNLACYRV